MGIFKSFCCREIASAKVAQVSNLLCRRLPSRQGLETSQRWRIGNPRYSRLEVCATGLRPPSLTDHFATHFVIARSPRRSPCPGGTCDNSPTFQRWDQRPEED